jgi:hypothetical protein
LQTFYFAIVWIVRDDASSTIGEKEVTVYPDAFERFFVPSHGIKTCADAGKSSSYSQFVDIEYRLAVDIQGITSFIFQFCNA